MRTPRHQTVSKSAIVLILLILTNALAFAVEWDWAKGKEWAKGSGPVQATLREQLRLAYRLDQEGGFMLAACQYFLLVQTYPESKESEIGLERLAKCLFEMEDYDTAYLAIEQVIQTYPDTDRMADLNEIELRIAKKIMKTAGAGSYASGDKSRFADIKRGLEIVDVVIGRNPEELLAAEAHYVKGEGKLSIGELNAARTAFEKVRDEFPQSGFVERARLGILLCDSLVGQADPGEIQPETKTLPWYPQGPKAAENPYLRFL